MKQKVLITKDEEVVNREIRAGWSIESITAMHITCKGTSSFASTVEGSLCFVLTK